MTLLALLTEAYVVSRADLGAAGRCVDEAEQALPEVLGEHEACLRARIVDHRGFVLNVHERRHAAALELYASIPDEGPPFARVRRHNGMGWSQLKLGRAAEALAHGHLAVEAATRTIEALEGSEMNLAERLRHAVACANREILTAARDKPELEGITFQTELGTMLEKTARVEKLAPKLAESLGFSAADAKIAGEAAGLAKADLATQLVMEFTSLAGVMGKHSATREGLDAALCEAIFEAALPRSAGDLLPANPPGIAVAVADRLDTLAGLFAVVGLVLIMRILPETKGRSLEELESILIRN